jgi:hypothetical protein
MVTVTFLCTITGASGTVTVMSPESPTIVVIDAACNVAPDARLPGCAAGVVDVPAATVLVVVDDGCWPLAQYGGHVVTVGTDNVKVTGPEVTVNRANPVSSVVHKVVQEELLLRVPGASGAVQRIDIPFNNSPVDVCIVTPTEDRGLRVPVETVSGM